MVTFTQHDWQLLVSSLLLYGTLLSTLSALLALLLRDFLFFVCDVARPLRVYLLKLQRLRRAYGLSYSQAHRLATLLKFRHSTRDALLEVRGF